jgi:soluble lytic murein transglycosylase-like protein
MRSVRTYVVLIVAFFLSVNAYGSDSIRMLIPDMIKAAEIKYNLPEGILKALVKVESSFNHKALVRNDGTSGRTSYGLTQIQLDGARLVQRIKAKEEDISLKKRDLITPKKLMNPETNIEFGAAYLKWLLDEHEDNVAWALSCYNAGPNSHICKSRKYSPYVGSILNAWLDKTKDPSRDLASVNKQD